MRVVIFCIIRFSLLTYPLVNLELNQPIIAEIIARGNAGDHLRLTPVMLYPLPQANGFLGKEVGQ